MSKDEEKINDLETAYDIILDAIVTQQLAPGTKVSENILSNNYGISRATSRNLMERLVTKQLLTCVSQRITQVSPLTLLEVKQNFALRKMLLPEIIPLAASTVNFDELRTLNKKIQKGQLIKNDRSALNLLKLNKKLNLLICEEVEYPLMKDWARQLEDTSMRIYWLYIKTKNKFPYSAEYQDLIFQSMKTDNPTSMYQAIHDMITQTEERVLNAIFSHKQFYTQNLKV